MGVGNGCTSFLNNLNFGNKKIFLEEIRGKTIAVDIMGFIYRGMLRYNKKWIESIKFLINKFKNYKIKLVFVFDDNPLNNDKEHIFMKRQERHVKQKLMHQETQDKEIQDKEIQDKEIQDKETQDKETQEQQTITNLNNLNSNYVQPKINKSVIIQCEDLCDKLGISRIRIKGKEADEIFKFLIDNKIVDGCYSQDNDLISRGCKMVFYNLDYKPNNLDTIYKTTV